MKNITVAILIILLIAILALLLISFQVRETESALVTTFGRPTREIIEPGWYFRWPFPIQQIHKFDSRMRVLEAEMGETTTKGAVPIIVNTYVIWNIAEPLKFFNAVDTIPEAERKLRSRINDAQNKVIGQHLFSEFVNSDSTKINFNQIEDEMLTGLKESIRNDYGIDIRTLGIKQLKISKDVTEKVFERMRAARNRKTEATIAQGQAEATKIRTDADSKKTELLAAAEAMAKTIRGKGDAEAAKYYKLLEADPDLAMFLRDIEALKKILEERATVVFSAKTAPFKLLEEMPDLKPKK
jgi:membrane protease subunit HflC